jgi:precorrin-6B C5,15-methyltransferase / cobalt-precorrin-6B C5,C15-methyltransferase
MSGDDSNGSLLTVVGIGADGFDGHGAPAREAILSATLLVGSERQLSLVPETQAERRAWPSPIDSLVDELVNGTTGPACILASGDPMLHGIGATLARRVASERLTVYPFPSAFALACARLGWPEHETTLVSLTTEPLDAIGRVLQPGRRIIVFAHKADGVGEIAELLGHHGFGGSALHVLVELGGADE